MSNVKTKEKLPLKREFSAGGCVYKLEEQRATSYELLATKRVLWLLGKHSGYHKWVLPKGMIEKGERGIETAVRETEEEMGVKAKVIGEKPIHKEQYFFVAELKEKSASNAAGAGARGQESGKDNNNLPIRRVAVYQEDPGIKEAGNNKIRVFKTVTFYLMEAVGGDPSEHGWEMEDAGWFSVEEALEKMAFPGEKKALEVAAQMVK
jgi:8-oxo-dGTP pyrophosphatase MutT (NUDIX family)